MKTQMYNKQGDSELVANKQVQQRLIEGWSFKKPSVVSKHRPRPRKVEVDEMITLKPRKNVDLLGPEDLKTEEN